MKHSNSQLAYKICHYLEEIENSERPNVSHKACTAYIMKLTKGKSLSTLPERTLRHLLNLYHNILSR